MNIITVKEHASATLRPSDYFDLIMGAGTGGLSALFVGRMQMTVDDAIDAYLRVGEQGFKRSSTPLLQCLQGKESLFDGDSLTRVIGDIVQQAVGDRDAQLQDPRGVTGTSSDFCRTAVLATYSVYASAPPFVFRSYCTSIDPASTYSIHQAARATMATAGTFPPISIGSPPIAFIDAGVAGYNNPAEVALDEVTRIWPGAKITCLVSLGTGLQNIIRVGERSEDVTHVARRLMEDCEKVHDRIFQQFHRNRLGYYRFNVTTGLDGTDFREWDKETSGVIAGITEGYARKSDVVVSLNSCANRLTGNAPADSISRENYEARSIALLNTIKDDALAEKINAWLNAPDSSQNYNDACKKHHASTGSWFLDGKEFSSWKDGGRFLCIYGKPGCGKTILCSTIITNVMNMCKEKHSCALAYFFFDGRDAQSTLQLHDGFIRSLVRQFWAQYDGIPAPLVRLYGKGHRQPSTDALEEVLQQLCCGFTHSYIIIDSLDECAEREDLLTWSTKTASLKIGNLHLLATSRLEEDIKASLYSLMSITMEDGAVNRDIEAYIDLKINHRRLGAWPKEVQLHIKAILLDKAQGMFRWLAIQLEELQKCLNEAELDDQLKRLPKDLDETYFRILQRIPEQHRTAAKLFLQWTAFSAHPPTLEELAEAGAMEPGQDNVPKYNARRKLMPRDVLTACASLLIESESYVKLSHFSVKEYLLSDRISNTAAACFHVSERLSHSLISQTCLASLLRFDLHLVDDMLPTIPLAKYAAENWVFHVRLGGNENTSETQNLIMALFGCGIPLTNWIRLYDSENPWRNSKYLNRITHTPNPLYYASLLGFTDISLQLLEKVPTPDTMCGRHINSSGGKYGTALSAACRKKHVEIVRMLLDHGADANAGEGIALRYGSRKGHVEIIRMLLDHGADVNAGDSIALRCASNYGHVEIVRMLLDCGADVNADDGEALQSASSRGHVKIVRILLDCGADVNTDDSIAFRYASRNDHVEIVQMLLDHGADVSARDDSALEDTSTYGHVEILRMLLDHDADVNAGDGNALRSASSRGHVKIVRMLLDHGADVNANDGEALWSASREGHVQIVRMLLDRGADVNVQHGAAIRYASSNGQVEIVRMLLDCGADVNADDGEALRSASREGHVKIVRMLLDHGADVNADDGEALRSASREGHVQIVRMLLDCGADVNVQDGAAIRYASSNGHVEIVRMLLDCGADVDTGNGIALRNASSNGHIEIIRILLDCGADVNLRDGAALLNASRNDHVEIVQMLLDHGADVSARNDSALEDTSTYGHVEILRMLLDHGADVNARDGTALRIVSSRGRVDIAQMLLDHGPDINAGDGEALLNSSTYGHVEIVRMLLDRGANVNSGEALVNASTFGHVEIVRMLLDCGADVNVQDGAAIRYASREGHVKVVRMLLDRGADVNADDGEALQSASREGHVEIVQILLDRDAT